MLETKIPGGSAGKTGVDVQVGDEHGGANPLGIGCNLPKGHVLVNILFSRRNEVQYVVILDVFSYGEVIDPVVHGLYV